MDNIHPLSQNQFEYRYYEPFGTKNINLNPGGVFFLRRIDVVRQDLFLFSFTSVIHKW